MLNRQLAIRAAFSRRARAERREKVAQNLLDAGVGGAPIHDDVQDWILNLLQEATSNFSMPEVREFEDLESALESVDRWSSQYGRIVAMEYNRDEGAAFLVEAAELLTATLYNNSLFSKDGFTLVDPHAYSCCVVDYLDWENDRAAGGVHVRFHGRSLPGRDS